MDFYKHFPVSFNVSMLLGITMLKNMSNMFRNTHLFGEYSHFFTKLSMISTNNRDKSSDIVTTEPATKWINRPWSVLAEFWSVHPSFFHWKKIPFSVNFRTLPFMPLTISADTCRIVYRWCGISPYYDVLPIEINKIKYDIMFSSFPKSLPIITA